MKPAKKKMTKEAWTGIYYTCPDPSVCVSVYSVFYDGWLQFHQL